MENIDKNPNYYSNESIVNIKKKIVKYKNIFVSSFLSLLNKNIPAIKLMIAVGI